VETVSADTRATTNAGVGPVVISDVLIAGTREEDEGTRRPGDAERRPRVTYATSGFTPFENAALLACALREKRAPDTAPVPLRRDAGSRRARSVDLESSGGADGPSKAQVGAGHLRSGPHVRIVARALLRGRVVAERKESSGSLPRHDPIPREPITRNGHGETIASGRTSGPTPPRAVVRRIRPALSGSACASPG